MDKFIHFILGVIVSSISIFIVHNNLITEKNVSSIDNSIQIIQDKIEELHKYSSTTNDSHLLWLINNQKNIYSQLIASLNYKKSQFIHWINSDFKSDLHKNIPSLEADNCKNEIKKIQNKIDKDKKESAKYAPCLIKTLIDCRIVRNQLTLTSLETALIAHENNIEFLLLSDKSYKILPDDSKELAQLQSEIKEVEKKIENDIFESSKYRPCLVKTLIDSRIEQQKNTLAALEGQFLMKKYGIPSFMPQTKQSPKKTKQSREMDIDAL